MLRPSILAVAIAGCGSEDIAVEDADALQGVPVQTLAGKRFTVFYQVSADILSEYARNLPQSPDNAHVFSVSHPNGRPASPITSSLCGGG